MDLRRHCLTLRPLRTAAEAAVAAVAAEEAAAAAATHSHLVICRPDDRRRFNEFPADRVQPTGNHAGLLMFFRAVWIRQNRRWVVGILICISKLYVSSSPIDVH